MDIKKGKAICKLYKQGQSVTEIAKSIGTDHSVVVAYLKRYYPRIYDEEYVPFSEKRRKRLVELYYEYKKVYVRGAYTRTEMCEMLDCTTLELEAMFRKFKLKNQWLKTYNGQVTLCNVPKEFKDDVMKFANEFGFRSARDVAVVAINEFMLWYQLKMEECNEEETH